ncbi:MAG: alpha/beta fold hydrolase [Deltaproteobacteria bacterium]|nr:MAG: alpha/beta fold hydrolase [Deltaproteobacteria bacterium]
MPKANVQGINLYYEIQGSGYPLILIRGLGSNADHWYCQAPVFSAHYSVVVFDNRGIGRSDIPDAPFTISEMAKDTVLLMDVLGIAKAHILGISMGGMIAQEIARRYGQRVNGLILACTHCGGVHAVQTAPGILEDLSESLFAGTQEAIQKGMKLLFSDRTIQQNPDVVQRYREVSKRFSPAVQTLRHQIKAIQGHDTWEDLIHIQNPTLVLTGSEDVLIPPENSRILAERIPRAQLQVIEKVGHQLFIEEPDACNRAVLKFLRPLPE